MTYRQRLLAIRLATEHAHDVPSMKRAQLDLCDVHLDEDAASSAEQGSPSAYVVPCYECGCRAARTQTGPSYCVDCQPKPEPHGGPQAPTPDVEPGFSLGGLTPPEGWPYCQTRSEIHERLVADPSEERVSWTLWSSDGKWISSGVGTTFVSPKEIGEYRIEWTYR